MAIASSLQHFLHDKKVPFQIHSHQAETSLSTLCIELGIDPCQVAVPVLLQSLRQATLMAVVPLGNSLDLDRLSALLRREFEYLDEASIARWFPDVEPGAEPPLAEPYRLPCIVEGTLLSPERIFFRGGSHSELISVDSASFQQLMQAYPKVVISNPATTDVFDGQQLSASAAVAGMTDEALRAHLEKMNRLPAMPAMALTIIRLLGSPTTTITELADAIELDPGMTAQVIRYARSPYFGYRGRIDSVQDAITRVLGFDLVSSIALGIASGRAFTVPQDGPYGLKAFWKHALYCAVVCQSLARKINQPELLNPSTAYLCGLLHNIGVLLQGHLFPDGFAQLNQLALEQPEKSLSVLEEILADQSQIPPLMAVGHERLGSCLMALWRLPEPVVAVCRAHHSTQQEGPHRNYVQLVHIANRLLAQRGVGDLGVLESASSQFGSSLISMTEAETVFAKVMEMCSEIDSLADQIAA